MRLDLATTLHLSLDSEAGEYGSDPAPNVIALVDRRGRRLLIPVRGRLHRHQSSSTIMAQTGIPIDTDFISGTIH